MDYRLLNLVYCIITGSASTQVVNSQVWDYEEGVKFFVSLLVGYSANIMKLYNEVIQYDKEMPNMQ